MKRFHVMANIQKRFPENVIGELFVDSTCIDCETSQQLAPETFEEAGNHTFGIDRHGAPEQCLRLYARLSGASRR